MEELLVARGTVELSPTEEGGRQERSGIEGAMITEGSS